MEIYYLTIQSRDKFMLKIILLSIITVFLNQTVFSQQEKYTAPVKWERYKVPEKQISILFPKLPVFNITSSACEEIESANYTAFAENVVYQLRIVSKSERKIPDSCEVKKEFGKDAFVNRLNDLKGITDKVSETKLTQNKYEITEIREKFTTIWIFEDLKNERWFELSMTYRENLKLDMERFKKSIEIKKNQRA